MTKKEKLKKNFPVTLTLGFKTQELKDAFVGQFLDGWGEGANIQVDLDWKGIESASEADFFAMEDFDGGEKEED